MHKALLVNIKSSQLPTMIPPSCFLWIFVASSDVKCIVWRSFLKQIKTFSDYNMLNK